MAGLISAAKTKTAPGGGLKKARDAQHDPADLSVEADARLLRIPLTDLAYNPENPRDEDIEADPETVELAESMKVLGQQQSAVVVPREMYVERWPEHAGTIAVPWVLMIGNRRKAAAGLNGWADLECVVRDTVTADRNQLADLPIHENLHRKGINPLRMAYYLHDQVALHGSQRAVAKRVGKTQPWVNQLLTLLNLIPDLQALVKSAEITATTGRTLAKLPTQEQERVWRTAAELDDEARAEFWATGAWVDKPFITPPATDAAAADEPTEAQQDAVSSPADADVSDVDGKPRPIVIRVADRSVGKLAAAIRGQLSADEVDELVTALS